VTEPHTITLDAEARISEGDHAALRLWLRMFTCTQRVEQHIRAELRRQFGTTLPRFDLMAQLERCPDGLLMTELSQRMMVTGGNVTGITHQLVAEGLVERCAVPGDRRAACVRLTAQGREVFRGMARAHERWVRECFATLAPRDAAQLFQLLGKVKRDLPVSATSQEKQ
jgi:DNA-binding MarR family transcriptional regulator